MSCGWIFLQVRWMLLFILFLTLHTRDSNSKKTEAPSSIFILDSWFSGCLVCVTIWRMHGEHILLQYIVPTVKFDSGGIIVWSCLLDVNFSTSIWKNERCSKSWYSKRQDYTVNFLTNIREIYISVSTG